MTVQLVTNEKVAEASSKGNQKKYYASRDRSLIADRVCECILTRQKV